ncbi:rhomboid family intramembrane serine protease [Candidatus Gracilibacteria bacterium]|nr:rhomboid family intramembrane serine protease [Candidatus Gracilibacteria bacterium]
MFPFYPQKYISHFLIVICAVITGASFLFPFLGNFAFFGAGWGRFSYATMIGQVILFQFLHGGIMHLLLNSYFLYMVGPETEARMSQNEFISFFIFSTVFVVLGLTFFAPYQPTVGISGFCMALMSYIWVDLKDIHHPMKNQVGIMLAINIGIGLVPGWNISLFGHLFGAIAGVAWWYVRKKLF